MSNRRPVLWPKYWHCATCLDAYYFSLVMQLDTPKAYLDFQEPAAGPLRERGLESVRAAGGLR